MTRRGEALSIGSTMAVCLLGLTQIIGYGALYYSFGVLAPAIARDFGWAESTVFAALSAGFLAGGVAAPMVGKIIDRFGAPPVMAAGSIAAAGALGLVGLAQTPWQFFAAMLAAQIAAMAVQYEAAFACLVQISGPRARPRINQLTLIAGFSSSLFWPLTLWLAERLGWRDTLIVFAAANLVICAPIHLMLARARDDEKNSARPAAPAATRSHPARAPLPEQAQRQALILATIGFALSGFLLAGVLAPMTPLLISLEVGPSAVLVSTLFGPG